MQARGPAPASSLSLRLPNIGDPITLWEEPAAAARGDVAAAREGRLVSRGATFLLPSQDEEEREPQDEDTASPLTTTRGRHDLRHGIARMLRPTDGTRGPAVCGCGRAGHEVDDVAVHLSDEGRAYATGVYRCDSAVLCTTCAPRRAFEIQERLTRATQACVERGGSVWFVTPTVRRIKDQPLAAMRSGFQDAFREARQGAGWVGPSTRAGVLGLSGVVEAPWSPLTGWGLHGHYLVFFDHRNSDRARAACELLIDRFLARLPEHGLTGTLAAQNIQECADAEKAAKYCGKVAAELAHGWVKKARKQGSTAVHAFALAAKASMKDVDVPGLERVSRARCRELWIEYAAAMKGIRLGVVSHHLARKLGIPAAPDDEQPGIRQLLEDERIGTVETPTWDRLVGRGLVGEFFARVESSVRLVEFDDDDDDVEPEYVGWREVRAWALEAGREDNPGDDEFLRPDRRLSEISLPTPEELAASAEADRAMALRRIAVSLRADDSAGTAKRIQLAIDAEVAAHPGIAPIRPGEVVRVMAA